MALPIATNDALTVHAIDAEAGVIVLRDADGTLHVVEYQGTLVPTPVPDRLAHTAA
jgi:hypothetical protein